MRHAPFVDMVSMLWTVVALPFMAKLNMQAAPMLGSVSVQEGADVAALSAQAGRHDLGDLHGRPAQARAAARLQARAPCSTRRAGACDVMGRASDAVMRGGYACSVCQRLGIHAVNVI